MQSAEYRSVEVIVVVNSRVVDAVEVVDSRRKDRGKNKNTGRDSRLNLYDDNKMTPTFIKFSSLSGEEYIIISSISSDQNM